jgi:hypothetical protein
MNYYLKLAQTVDDLQLGKFSNYLNETLIFTDFLKKKCIIIFVAQGRNPSPGEE